MDKQEMDDVFRPDGQEETPAWVWMLAVASWAVAVFTMYHVEHSLYGGILQTNTLSLGAMPLVFLVAWSREEAGGARPETPWRERWKKIRIRLTKGIVAFFAAVLVGYLAFFGQRRDVVMLFQLLGLGLICIVPSKKFKKLDAAWGFFSVYAVLAVATLAAPRIAGYATVAEAAGALRAQGYGAVVFQQAPHGRMIRKEFPGAGFTQEELGTSVYLFSAEKDGEPWGVAVSPVHGAIIGEMPAPEGSELSRWLQMQEE